MSSNQAFDRALQFVLRWEGGYSNHPADTGGETNKGITHTTYDAYRRRKGLPKRSVRYLEQHELEAIYHEQYWIPAGCDLLPAKLALIHFDWAVNSGVNRAVKALQSVVGTNADGVIGPNTKAAISRCLQAHSEAWMCSAYCMVRENCYRRWATGSQRVFLTGWLNRLAAVRSVVS